jgi:hypothetical protein
MWPFTKTETTPTKSSILDELALYKEKKLLEIDKELEQYKVEQNQEIQNLAWKCAADTAKYEHEYHSTMEARKVELAKLDALIEAKKEILKNDSNTYTFVGRVREEEIERLNNIIKLLISKVPTQVTQNIKP